MRRAHSPWVVLKFGGTSVSSLANWKNIASIVKKRGASGAPVLVVHSAVTKITDALEKLDRDRAPAEARRAARRHREAPPRPVRQSCRSASAPSWKYFTELKQIASGIALIGEVSDKTRARLMSNGELMATEIGARFLASQGINVKWGRCPHDAEARKSARARPRGASLLSATCNFRTG